MRRGSAQRGRLDVDVPDALIFDMPMEFGLERVAIVGAHLADLEQEECDHGIDEVDGVGLIVPVVDFQGAHTGGVIDGRVLIALDRLCVFAIELQELHLDLDLMSGHLLLVALDVDLADARASRQTAQSMSVHGA